MYFIRYELNCMVVNLWYHFYFGLSYITLTLSFEPFPFGWSLTELFLFKKKMSIQAFQNAHGYIIKVDVMDIK